MEPEWSQMGMLLATIGLVAVSWFGVAVNYFLLRSRVDPDVVVYTAHDDRRPSVLTIIIENIGHSPAYDVRFGLCRPIPKTALGRMEPMQEGPLIDGIPVLGPGARRVLTWGQFGALREALGDASVRVSATYESRRRWFPWDPTEHTSNSILEIRSFLATDASESPELRGVRALEQLSKDLSVVRADMRTVAKVVQKTGDRASD